MWHRIPSHSNMHYHVALDLATWHHIKPYVINSLGTMMADMAQKRPLEDCVMAFPLIRTPSPWDVIDNGSLYESVYRADMKFWLISYNRIR